MKMKLLQTSIVKSHSMVILKWIQDV